MKQQKKCGDPTGEKIHILRSGTGDAAGLATNGGGVPLYPTGVLQTPKDQPTPPQGHQTIHTGTENPRRVASLAQKRPKIRLWATPRRTRIDPAEKRHRYVDRLENLWGQLDTIIVNPQTEEKNRIKAMNTLIRCLNIVYGMVEAMEVEEIEKEIKELEEKERQSEKQGDLGYKLPDPAP
ncbi:MAG: hypothetical protein NWE89_13895 [Candidatus Bathyarchaeota archaeon]|nr:hypothetical protein [Candidatus Bathyarchaeota archaeon]